MTTDANDRRDSDRELEHERVQFQALYDNFPEPTLTYEFVDDEPIIRAVNDAFVEVFGYEPDTAVGTSVDDLLVPPDRLDEAQDLDERVRNGELVDIEIERQTAKGMGQFWFRNIPVPGPNPPDGFAVYADISDRKEREEELRQLKDEFETVFETARDAIFLWDVETTNSGYEFRLQRLNPAHEAISGLSTEADRGKTPRELLGEEAGTEVAANYRRCVEAKEPVTYEERLELPAGTIHWQTKLAPVVRNDEVTQIVGVARDVTDRKDREQELERYETIVETAGDPVYTLDADGRITYVNEALVEVTGHDEETLLGEHASKVMSDEHVERGAELIRELLNSNRDRGTFEMDIITASGRRIPCENHIGLLPYDEEFQGTVGVVRDISERIERERELQRQNERLDDFAGVVSHDLRNPLNVATGRMELAAEDGERRHLEAAIRALDRMEELIEDMLSMARAGEAVGETESVELSTLTENCWRNVETESARLVMATETRIRADRTRLQQLFENLLRNAVEHGGPEVEITVGDLPDGFYVEDDGPGIPAEDREQVIEPGFTTSEEGTGFGLSIVRDIAAAHGWDIDITSSEDGGARFEFTGVRRG